MNVAHHQSKLVNPIDRALLAYFHYRPGQWIDRNTAMRACGFDSPSEQPVGAYVQFANSLIRINREIEHRGLIIIRSEDALDLFSLQSAEGYGK